MPADSHTEMHEIYARINEMAETRRQITHDDCKDGRTAEIIRWARNRLGGRDQDLIPPDRWETACREGWSKEATYSCLPRVKSGGMWHQFIHDVAHFIYLMLPLSRFGYRNYDNHSLARAHIELELTTLVVGWLTDEANGIKDSFPPLALSRPPDLRSRVNAA
jgi:hypothetical protein